MVNIIIKIPDSKMEEFKKGYLKVNPNEQGQTDLSNVRSFIIQKLRDIYITGKTEIAREEHPAVIDTKVVED